jgi:hypothetical protein
MSNEALRQMLNGMTVDQSKRKPVLEDHVAVKRKLIPRFMHALGDKLSQYSWTRQLVPEAIWLALIIDRHGYIAARNLCLDLIKAATNTAASKILPPLIRLSSFTNLDEEQKSAMVSELNQSVRHEISDALAALTHIAPHHPLGFLAEGLAPAEFDGERFSKVLEDCYDRSGKLAVLAMALGQWLGMEQGKVHIAPHLVEDVIGRLQDIADYPNTDASLDAVGGIRASAPMLFMQPPTENDMVADEAAWVGEFWDRVAGFGSCMFADTLQDETLEDADEFTAFVVNYRNAVRADLRARLRHWRLDLKHVEVFEVVAALLCRQATLAIDLGSSPAIWNPHTAPIMLRAMADVFITLAWILKDPEARSKQFVDDGLGAIKLQIAHHERALETYTDPAEREQTREMIEMWQSWLDSQRMSHFIEVNLGSWSGISTRKMADEAGFIDFYNYVYQPFSSVAHSNWAHVSMFNTIFCENPAHRRHRAPAIAPIDGDPHWLFLATKYLSKTFHHFDEVMQLSDMPDSAFDFMLAE